MSSILFWRADSRTNDGTHDGTGGQHQRVCVPRRIQLAHEGRQIAMTPFKRRRCRTDLTPAGKIRLPRRLLTAKLHCGFDAVSRHPPFANSGECHLSQQSHAGRRGLHGAGENAAVVIPMGRIGKPRKLAEVRFTLSQKPRALRPAESFWRWRKGLV